MRQRKQRGYLIMVAAMLVVVMGFIGTAAVYLFSGNVMATSHFSQSEKAFYIAEAGLEKATRFLLTPTLTVSNIRISCSAVDANASLTNTSFGAGTFTVSDVSGSPVYANDQLSGAITSSASTIPVGSTSGFASSGTLVIDRENINYTGISGNSFIGATRGVNNTVASSHAASAWVSQYQCIIDSIGGIPSVNSALVKRELQEGVLMQEAWAVGNSASGAFVFTHWNYPTALTWTSAPITSASNGNLNSISLLSNADGWAVGNVVGTNFNFFKLSGTTWSLSQISGGCSSGTTTHLLGVSAVSSRQAWAVGGRTRVSGCSSGSAYRYTVFYWNGTTWTRLTSSTTPPIPANGTSTTIRNLNNVKVIDTTGDGLGDVGFAVGDNGTILEYNGTAWTADTSGVTNNLYGLWVVSANEAWAVGASGRILKWNGSTWSTVTSPTSTQLNQVSMIDTDGDGLANYGWAVGNSGVAVIYNGTSWSLQSPGGGNLIGVSIFNKDDVWAVGASGRAAHWDGTAWSNITSGVSAQLNEIAPATRTQYPISGWHEIFS